MEIFDVCDEYGNPTGETVTREYAHSEDVLHRTAHIWVVRRKENGYDVLLQKRSLTKDSFPGCLDTSSAGHIHAGDEPVVSAQRELEEELGIKAEADELKPVGKIRVHYEKEFHGKMFRDNEIINIFRLEKAVSEDEIKIQEEELSGVEWHDIDEVIEESEKRNPLYCVPRRSIKCLKKNLETGEFLTDI